MEPTVLGSSLPWDYTARARELIRVARDVLDLGTGGGEVFGEILFGATVRAVATEPWHVNVPVAAQRLRGLASVVHASSLRLPFHDQTFNLVLDRHEELAPTEVARVLRPGGRILTQQVIPDSWRELRAFFPRMTDFGPHFHQYQAGFQDAGMDVVDARVHEYPVAFRSLGDLVYSLAVAPWTIPDFDVRSDLDALLDAERTLRRPEGIVLTDGRYLIEACKIA